MPDFEPPTPLNQKINERAVRLANLGYTALIVGASLYWFNSPWQSPMLNLLIILICVMGVIPILRWLQRNDLAYPLYETLQLTLIPFYAVPLLTEHEAVITYSEPILIQASWIVLLFQICCALGALQVQRTFTPSQPRYGAWWSDVLIPESNLRFTSYTLILTTIWLVILNFTRVPSEIMGTLRAVFFGIGTISAFIQARMWGTEQLRPYEKRMFVINIALQIILSSLSLLLINSLITMLLVLVGYFSTARRIPWVLVVAVLPLFAVLHAGKHKMRDKYWGEYSHDLSVVEVPGFYVEWFQCGVAAGDKSGDENRTTSGLFERASLLQIVCYAVDTVPARTPFFGGASYSYVLPQIAPRFLWPGKPSPNDSVKMLSVRLGMLTEEQAETTSIGYGLITEAFVNFGNYGVSILGLILGWSLNRIAKGTAFCSTLSIGGIFRILCLAWCLNTETTLAVWLSSLYQACIAIFGPLILYRSLFHE